MANIQPRKNKDGKIISYCIRVHKGRDTNGKQLKPYTMTFFFDEKWSEKKIQAELQKAATLFENECKKGFVADNKQTFERYANYVIDLKERIGVKHRTIVRYKELLERIKPAIGHYKLCDLKPQHLNAFYDQLSKDGINKATGGKLSSKTIIEHHRLIRTILAEAEKELLVPYNAASKATPPKNERKEANYIEIEDIERILFYSLQEPLKKQVALNLLIFTGCRRGEIMGLQWSDIDFKNNLINIKRTSLYSKDRGIYQDTPKTEQSKRSISVPAKVMELLRVYKKEYNTKRLALGTAWTDTGFILVQENGKPMHPDTLTDYCSSFRTKYNNIIEKENKDRPKTNKLPLLPHINPHAFRHSQASMLILSGLDCATVSKRLGHANISTTTNIYTHILHEADKKASDKLENILLNQNKQKQVILN
ncbi:integrase family protein [Clostridium sp. CAG:967]|nr:integrase family protein [Clostridium sp. CAG:967]